MRKKKTFLLAVLLLPFLAACSGAGASSSSSSEASSSASSTGSSSSSTSSSSSSSSSYSSSSSSSSSSEEPLNGTYHFYAVNDFHGSILERYVGEGTSYEGGILKVFGKLKALKDADPEHTFIISSGDMFQGSLESNHFYGMSVLEAMNYVGFDSMTLGNHEFDYGQERLMALKNAADFPFLAGNIFKYENGAKTNIPWGNSDISTVIERGGARVGIIGMIGSNQTTSITSKYVQDVTFEYPNTLITQEATRLRQEEGCDIVILSIHNDSTGLSRISNLKNYVDLVFGAHTHELESEVINNEVPYLQGLNNGRFISHISLKAENGAISYVDHENIQADYSWEEDAGLAELMDKYIGTEEFTSLSNKELCDMYGNLTSSWVGALSAKAIYEKYKDYDNDGETDLVCGVVNSQRASIGTRSETSTVTYSDLYKATPFMNCIVILRVTGSEILTRVAQNESYSAEYEKADIVSDQYYEIAVIDYLAYHQNNAKTYDYFSSMADSSNLLAEYEDYPFDITADYLYDTYGATGKTFYYSDVYNAAGYNVF